MDRLATQQGKETMTNYIMDNKIFPFLWGAGLGLIAGEILAFIFLI